MVSLISQNDILDYEIEQIIFVNHSGVAFDLIKSSSICKFRFSDGISLIDKLCITFKKSVVSGDGFSSYYRRLIFEVLTSAYSSSTKLKEVIMDLHNFSGNLSDKDVKKDVMCLINELKLFKKHLDKNCITEHDRRIIQKSFNVKDNFSRLVEKESELIYPFDSWDLRDKKIITLDSKFKTAYDDAISVEKTGYGYLLGIYISDVASYICNDTVLYEEAFQRGESIYTNIDNSSYIPMFPHSLTREFFSLNSSSERKVVAHFFRISKNFKLIGASVARATINVSKNYSFDDVDRIKSDDSNYDMICLLSELADGLKSYFNLDYHFVKEQNGGVIRKNKYLDSGGSNIITVSTLFLNSYIAEVMSKKKYPFIYRVNDTVLSDRLLNSSIYSVNDFGHVVNNGNCYGHVSNPIRSFASLLNQFFELNLLVDGCSDEFISEWSSKLPLIVDELNMRLSLNSEYKGAIEKIFSKQLTKKR